MTLQGHFHNGVIVLDEPVNLPDGIRVRVELLPAAEAPEKRDSVTGSHYSHYQSIIGVINDLPVDFAAQHDHYIHGTPQK